MFRKVKKWLGIDGVKIDVDVPEEIFLREKKISGWLIIESKQDSMIQKIRMRLEEKYSRGREQNRLIDEYELGNILQEEIGRASCRERSTSAVQPVTVIK